MSRLISQQRLADLIGVSPSALAKARQKEQAMKGCPHYEWAVYDARSRLIGYEVPEGWLEADGGAEEPGSGRSLPGAWGTVIGPIAPQVTLLLSSPSKSERTWATLSLALAAAARGGTPVLFVAGEGQVGQDLQRRLHRLSDDSDRYSNLVFAEWKPALNEAADIRADFEDEPLEWLVVDGAGPLEVEVAELARWAQAEGMAVAMSVLETSPEPTSGRSHIPGEPDRYLQIEDGRIHLVSGTETSDRSMRVPREPEDWLEA